MGGDERSVTRTHEVVTYAVAFAVVATLGAVLRSVVLNWIVGPALVVGVVVVLTRWLEHRERGSP